ncbi:hypothetical protein JTE90_009276 [Oedothorax gibbosus]|uniref:Uncharacterized protein n=1 Tax=Oedothorax gibbosus TaxID=931172 RepID=A0AAV6V1K9_9ARAC|nr:hypothetical protein JTE90_009276 [Oedothorax gibbosus]
MLWGQALTARVLVLERGDLQTAISWTNSYWLVNILATLDNRDDTLNKEVGLKSIQQLQDSNVPKSVLLLTICETKKHG